MNRVVILATILWTVLGLRLVYDATLAPDTTPASLRLPFSEFGLYDLRSGWQGMDVPLDKATEDRAGTTAYINRYFTDKRHGLWVYVGFVSGWTPESIHYPDICFPATGLELRSKETLKIPVDGFESPLAFHEYQWSRGLNRPTYTLSTFYYNGKFAPAEYDLRMERILGVRHFTILTISGDFVGSLQETREHFSSVVNEVVPALIRHMPEDRPEDRPEDMTGDMTGENSKV